MGCTPSTITSHFSIICKEMLKAGAEDRSQGIPAIVIIDLLDVIFDIFGEDDMDPIFKSLGLFDLLQGVFQCGTLFQRCQNEIFNAVSSGLRNNEKTTELHQHVQDTLTNLKAFLQYKTSN